MPLVLSFLLGAALAGGYLFILWLTVERIRQHPQPVRWLMTSLILRMVLLLGSFYLIMGDGHWERVLAALAGFALVRMLTVGNVNRQIAMSGAGGKASHDDQP